MVSRADPAGKKSVTPMERDHELGRSTWPEVAGTSGRVILVPVGSCEQHGPHLPLDTDTRIASAVATAVAEQRDDVVVAPPVTYGASGEHQSFPGTLSIGTEALTTVLVELGRSAFPGGDPRHRALVFVNGHGGNSGAVRGAVEILVGEARPVSWWAPQIPGADAHAGRTETSLLLAISPDAVRALRPVGNTTPVSRLLGQMRADGVAAVSDNGVLGDASGASEHEGRAVLDALVGDLNRHVDDALDAS